MKIALVLDAIYPYNKGGREKRMYELSTRLARRGHSVHLYTMKWWHGDNHRIENGVHLHGFSPYFPLYTRHVRSITQAVVFGFYSCMLLFADFDIMDVDHMPHFHLFPLRFLSFVRRKKMVITWHEVWGKTYWLSYVGKKGIAGFLIERLTLSLSAPIIAVSEATAQKIRSIEPKRDVSVVPNGVDMAAIAKIPPSPHRVDVIFVGRLLAHKQVDLLLEAIALVKKRTPSISCCIIGKGPEKSRLEARIQALSLSKQVTILSSVEHEAEIYARLKSANMLVLPSIREGFGIVALEANACGVPVITIRHPENATTALITEGVNGLVCEGSADAIARSIHTLLTHAVDKQALLAGVRRYDWDAITTQVEEIYERISRH